MRRKKTTLKIVETVIVVYVQKEKESSTNFIVNSRTLMRRSDNFFLQLLR